MKRPGLEIYERAGESYRLDKGKLVSDDGEDEDGDEALEALEQFAGPDCSFADYLARRKPAEEERQQEIGYVEGFNAADASEASALALGIQQRAEDAIEGDRLWKLPGGYDQLTAYLVRQFDDLGGTVMLNAEVTRVAWDARGGASCLTRNGRTFHAARCLVTVPLGVLQAGTIQFEPEIPTALAAAGRMRMGPVCRFTMVFRRGLWPEQMSFLLTPELSPPVWWTSYPAESHTLTGWSGGPRALTLLALDEPALREHAIAAAASALGLSVEQIGGQLVSFHTFDWSADPNSRGAYSWVPVGGVEASEQMTRPIEGVLFFAGEHTDTTGHWGTVHAALRSGLRAAEQILHKFPS